MPHQTRFDYFGYGLLAQKLSRQSGSRLRRTSDIPLGGHALSSTSSYRALCVRADIDLQYYPSMITRFPHGRNRCRFRSTQVKWGQWMPHPLRCAKDAAIRPALNLRVIPLPQGESFISNCQSFSSALRPCFGAREIRVPDQLLSAL